MIISRLFSLMLLLAAGCADDAVTTEERLASELAYDSLLQHVPDSVLARLAPIDSLFLSYQAPSFEPVERDSAVELRWVDSVLGTMTLDEKIGQLFIINLEERGLRRLFGSAENVVEKFGVGGFLVPRLLAPRDVFRRTQRLQKLSKVPLFFAADYERGAGRFNNAFTELPSNMAIGATRDTLFAAAAGRLSAIESRASGINLLFAPVVDVNNNADNPIINIRSYGENPELVGQMAAAFVHQAQAHGILTTLKHFPGHGNTSVDSHSRMGVIEGDSASLESVELRPYRIVMERPPQPGAIMTAHLWIRALEPRPQPATFSRRILHDLLRQEMGFEGIVITDDIKMGALQNTYSAEDRVVRPLLAGADVILTPADLDRAVEAVRNAVRAGRLTEDDIDGIVRRILTAKASIGLYVNRFAGDAGLDSLLAFPRGAYIAQAVADRSITLVRNEAALPLRPTEQRITVVHITNQRGSESIDAAMSHFGEILDAGERLADLRLEREPSNADAEKVLEAVRNADVVLLPLYLRLQSGRGEAGLYPRQENLVRRILREETPVVLITFGNPYAAGTFSDAEAIVVAYDQSLESIRAAVRVAKGEQQAPGRLPITVQPFPYGSGIDGVH